MNKFSFILFILFLSSCSTNCNSKKKEPLDFDGKVIAIKDGDTYEIMRNNKPITIRLEHIDCPEKNNLLEIKQNYLHLNYVMVKLLE